MSKSNRINWFLSVGFSALLVYPLAAWGGAPVPIPETGPHKPEHQLASIGSFEFESGEVIEDFKISYVTHGRLSENRDNVILAMQSFAADHHSLDFLIGPGKGLDTDKYFIVATDFISNAFLRQDVTTGPTNSGLRMEFPRFTVGDWVNLEYKFLNEHLSFDRILAAVGASVAGMKAYRMAISHPDFVAGIIAIAGSPKTNPQTQMVLKNVMNDIMLDSGWYNGNYEVNPATGLNTSLMNMVPWWHSNKWFVENIKSPEGYQKFTKYWRDIWTIYAPQDARDIYYQMNIWANFNVGDTPGYDGDARAALSAIEVPVLLIGGEDDMLARRDEIIFAKNAIPNATHLEIGSPYGHLVCCGAHPEAVDIMNPAIAEFLSGLR